MIRQEATAVQLHKNIKLLEGRTGFSKKTQRGPGSLAIAVEKVVTTLGISRTFFDVDVNFNAICSARRGEGRQWHPKLTVSAQIKWK